MKKYLFIISFSCIAQESVVKKVKLDPFFIAIISENEKGVAEIIAAKNYIYDNKDRDGRGYIATAAYFSTAAIFSRVASAGVGCLMDVDNSGNTLFHELASSRRDLKDFSDKCDCIVELMNSNFPGQLSSFINRVNNVCDAPLDVVARAFDHNRVEKLISVGATVDRDYFVKFIKESGGKTFADIFKSNGTLEQKTAAFKIAYEKAKRTISIAEEKLPSSSVKRVRHLN